MARRLFDVTLSLLALLVFAPVLAAAAIGIRLSSPGPILFRVRRVGRNGETFVMYKLRTMHYHEGTPSRLITGTQDARIFAFGSLLRRLKFDELPQFYNVLRGDMAIVGPRPEDPRIVSDHYTRPQWETLRVPPGLASPGSIYNYTHGDAYLAGDDPEGSYIRSLLPIKLALETVYARRASFFYDVQIVGRTLSTIFLILLGKRRFPDPPEMAEALSILQERAPDGALTPFPWSESERISRPAD